MVQRRVGSQGRERGFVQVVALLRAVRGKRAGKEETRDQILLASRRVNDGGRTTTV